MIGPVFGGLLASVIASVAGGAIAGLVGALVGAGVPEEEAKRFEQQVKAGRTLVTVRTVGRVGQVRSLFRRHGGYDLRGADRAAQADDAPAPR